jgi:hypothetical protein
MDSAKGPNSGEIIPSELWFDCENGETNPFGVVWWTNYVNEEDNVGCAYGSVIDPGTMVYADSPLLPLPAQILTDSC